MIYPRVCRSLFPVPAQFVYNKGSRFYQGSAFASEVAGVETPYNFLGYSFIGGLLPVGSWDVDGDGNLDFVMEFDFVDPVANEGKIITFKDLADIVTAELTESIYDAVVYGDSGNGLQPIIVGSFAVKG